MPRDSGDEGVACVAGVARGRDREEGKREGIALFVLLLPFLRLGYERLRKCFRFAPTEETKTLKLAKMVLIEGRKQ